MYGIHVSHRQRPAARPLVGLRFVGLRYMAAFVGLFVAMLASGGAAEPSNTPWAIPVDGAPFCASLVGIDSRWQVTFDAKTAQQVMPVANLVRWGAFRNVDVEPTLVTAAGGLLVADVTAADQETLTVDAPLFGPLTLPIETLAGVIFAPPAATLQRDRLFDQIVQAKGESDLLLLHNGDRLRGTFDGMTDDRVEFTTDVGPLAIEPQRIAAIVFNPTLRAMPPAEGLRVWTGFADGSRLLAQRLVVGRRTAEITTAATMPWKTSAAELVALQPLGGRATYLSDLEPIAYSHVPFLDLKWPLAIDRSVAGGRLRAGGRVALKGLGMHSAARLTYPIPTGAKRFEAAIGIDDTTAGRGSVRFRVVVDDRECFASDILRGGMAPVPVSVDVAGAKRLDLWIDFADRADTLDRADWLHARFVE